ncbi:MAG: restriction endonuclease [Clostridiales bacterium]|nr:restriction endonuclease [Clostridiales bacterium]
MKNATVLNNSQAKALIVKFASKPVLRKELVEKCIADYAASGGLTNEELADKTSGAPLNIVKCRLGDAIEQLLQNNTLEQNSDKKLSCRDPEADIDIDRDEIIENCIFEILNETEVAKKSMLGMIIERTRAALNVTTDVIKSDAGRILSGLVKNNQIVISNNKYAKVKPPETPDEKNRRLLDEISDEALVDHSVAMLKQWYEKIGFTEVVGLNTDGPNDGGIDGRLTAVDPLGFKETVILQVKNYHNPKKQVPECEVREFCGVLTAESEATKGLFVTSRKYHNNSVKFAKKYKQKYLVLIDGEKWLELAKQCEYVIE